MLPVITSQFVKIAQSLHNYKFETVAPLLLFFCCCFFWGEGGVFVFFLSLASCIFVENEN